MTSTLNLKPVLVGIAVVLGLGAEGYQVINNEPATIEVYLSDGFGKVAEAQNVTIPSVSPGQPAQTPVTNSTMGVNATHEEKTPESQEPIGPAEPKRNEQKPKYIPGYDFTVNMEVSQTPIEYVPWSGDGAPFVNLYYRNLDGTAFQDTGMLHFADMYMQSETRLVGPCTAKHFEFAYGRWTSTSPLPLDLTNRSLVYWSNPLPDDWFNLFQDGKNCYWDVTEKSTWFVRTCAEGDGELAKHYRETKPDGTIVDHVDFVDYCFVTIIDVSPVP